MRQPELPEGTRWTAAGEGETLTRLHSIVAIHQPDGWYHVSRKLFACGGEQKLPCFYTNLALTGAPLTSGDCERILSPEFRVGPPTKEKT